MTEMLMTEQAATTTEGTAASQTPAPAQQQTAAATEQGSQQQAPAQNSQAAQDGQQAGQSEGDKAAEAKAPETYEFKAPEGRTFDDQIIKEYSDVAKELNMPQEHAQKLLDRLAPKLQERQMERLEAVRTEWAEAATADKEFGGEKLQENLALAKTALDKFGTPELRSLLNESGLGNNPEVIRFMFRAGKAISGDRFVGADVGAGGKPAPKDFSSQAAALYSNQQ